MRKRIIRKELLSSRRSLRRKRRKKTKRKKRSSRKVKSLSNHCSHLNATLLKADKLLALILTARILT